MSGAKTSLSMQKTTPKVYKPGKLNMSMTWNPNVPKSKTITRKNSESNLQTLTQNQEIQTRFRNEDVFNEIMDKIINVPLQQALEGPLKSLFKCHTCILWIENPENGQLYSPTHNLYISLDSSIVGYSRLTQSVIQIQDQNECPPNFIVNQSLGIPANSKHIIFPIISDGLVLSVIQLIRTAEMPNFSLIDLNSVSFIQKKFKTMGSCLFDTSPLIGIALNFFQKKPDPSQNILGIVEKFFQCRSAEIWKYDSISNTFSLYDRQKNTILPIQSTEIGIVGYSLINRCLINERMASTNEHFLKVFDGNNDGPILVAPYEKNKREIWGLALRGRSRSFNMYDEREVKALLPFLARAAIGTATAAEKNIYSLTSLLDISSFLISTMSINELKEVVKQQIPNLLECQDCVLLTTDESITNFVIENDEKISIEKGISGQCLRNQQYISIGNPSSESSYSPEIDLPSANYSISSLLAVPVFNLKDKPIAVIMFYNKMSSDKFAEDDEKFATLVSIFLGIALDNINRYKMSLDLSNSFQKLISDITVDEKESIESIMKKVLDLTFCDRITLYGKETLDKANVIISVGSQNSYGTDFAQDSIKNGSSYLLTHSQIKSRTKNYKEDLDKSYLTKEERCRSISQSANAITASQLADLFEMQESQEKNIDKEMMFIVPIANKGNSFVAAIEYHFLNSKTEEELDFLKAVASLFSDLSIFNKNEEIDLQKWIENDERSTSKIPKKLKIDDDHFRSFFKAQFDVVEWEGIDAIKVIFAVFAKYGLMNTFEFTNAQLFNFLQEVQKSYQIDSYHDWKHAIETFQYLSFEISTSRADRFLTKSDIFALLIASLCYRIRNSEDCNEHSNNESWNYALNGHYSINENQSILKTISLFSTNETNLFSGMSSSQSKPMWDLVIDLILSTDMSNHFVIVDQLSMLLSGGDFDCEENPLHKLLFMKIILKCADMSPLVRQFTIAQRCYPMLAEEFFRQGDITRCPNLVFLSVKDGLEKREEIDVERSFVPFLKSIVLPMFKLVSHAIKQLSSSTDLVNSNISKFEKM